MKDVAISTNDNGDRLIWTIASYGQITTFTVHEEIFLQEATQSSTLNVRSSAHNPIKQITH